MAELSRDALKVSYFRFFLHRVLLFRIRVAINMNALKNLDFYRKTSQDHTQATTSGGMMSILFISFVALLIGSEIVDLFSATIGH